MSMQTSVKTIRGSFQKQREVWIWTGVSMDTYYKLIFIIRLILHKSLSVEVQNCTKEIFLQVRQRKPEYKACMVSPLKFSTQIYFLKETEPKGWKWGLLSWEVESGEKHPQTFIPSGPFQFSLVQKRKRDSDRGRKGVYSPRNAVK